MTRIAIWAQSLLGSGHLKRATIIRDHLLKSGADVTLLTPSVENGMPVVRARDGSFSLVDETGQPVSGTVWRERMHWIETVLDRHPPDALVIEMWPFGRRQFTPEVLATIGCAKRVAPGCKVIGSVRDVLVTKGRFARYRDMRDMCLAHLDHLLVHGDPHFLPFDVSFPFTREIADRLSYTGHVHDGWTGAPTCGREAEIVVSAGGGRVGAALLDAALDVWARGVLADHRWIFIAGKEGQPQATRARARTLRSRVSTHAGEIEILAHVDDMGDRLARASLSISQAGYNSAVELVASGTPAIVVPYDDDGQDEQRIRASRLAKAGHVTCVDAKRLGFNALTRAIHSATVNHAASARPDLGGGPVTARRILQMAEG